MSYQVGALGAAGAAGTGGTAGGNGAAGIIIITEYFSTSDVISFDGMVTNKSATNLSIAYATFGTTNDQTACSANPCTRFGSSAGAWVSVAKGGSGAYAGTLATPFQSQGACWTETRSSSSVKCYAVTTSASNIGITCRNTSTLVDTDAAFDLFCLGVK
jgi:hypothetical protein